MNFFYLDFSLLDSEQESGKILVFSVKFVGGGNTLRVKNYRSNFLFTKKVQVPGISGVSEYELEPFWKNFDKKPIYYFLGDNNYPLELFLILLYS